MSDIIAGSPAPTKTPRTIADIDRPLPELVAALRASQPRTRYQPSAQELARQAAAAEHLAQVAAAKGLSPEEYIRRGERAIVGHLLHDEDPDSTEPALRVSLTKERAS